MGTVDINEQYTMNYSINLNRYARLAQSLFFLHNTNQIDGVFF